MPAPIDPGCGHGVIVADCSLAHDYQAQIFLRDAGLTQGDELRNCIVLAIAGSRGECRKRGRPAIIDAVLRAIAYGPDGEIEGAIDLAEPGKSLARGRVTNDPQKLDGRLGYTCVGRCPAVRQGLALRFDGTLHIAPFRRQRSLGQGRGEEAKRFGCPGRCGGHPFGTVMLQHVGRRVMGSSQNSCHEDKCPDP